MSFSGMLGDTVLVERPVSGRDENKYETVTYHTVTGLEVVPIRIGSHTTRPTYSPEGRIDITRASAFWNIIPGQSILQGDRLTTLAGIRYRVISAITVNGYNSQHHCEGLIEIIPKEDGSPNV